MIRVDYAGPGGSCEGMRLLGLETVGFEWDAAACATRAAAGHVTVRADLATYRPHHAPGSVEGYWASPPCQTFSAAGSGAGRGELDALVRAIDLEDWGAADQFDSKTRHVIDAARTAVTLGSEWVGMEQVPEARPAFEAVARRLYRHGYSTWVGVLNAADYGVPQTRKRTVLLASRSRCVHPPEATHSQDAWAPRLFGEVSPWISMADALEYGDGRLLHQWRGAGLVERHGERPDRDLNEAAFTITGASTRTMRWTFERPSTTVCADPRLGNPGHRDREGGEPQFGPDAIKLTIRDALILQSFRADYPVQGTKTKQFEQVGNAVPPVLAAHCVAAVTGLSFGGVR